MTPLPKRRHSTARAGKRHLGHSRKNTGLTSLTKCPSCDKFKKPHFACPDCGKN